MTNWALKLEYDGTSFLGWQFQPHGPTVQQVLDEAATKLAGAKITSIVAGRTDTGVHATGQVALITLAEGWRPERVREALNFHMKPHPVVVLQAAPAPEDWNPRFSAIGRHYRYMILNRRPRPGLDLYRAWHVPAPLDADLMHQAAQFLLGQHDFSSFRASSCQAKGPVRTMERINITREGEKIAIEVSARSFLHHQVRNIAGTLRWFGEGKFEPPHMAKILAAASRAQAGPTAPPEGLTLTRVDYNPDPFAQ